MEISQMFYGVIKGEIKNKVNKILENEFVIKTVIDKLKINSIIEKEIKEIYADDYVPRKRIDSIKTRGALTWEKSRGNLWLDIKRVFQSEEL